MCIVRLCDGFYLKNIRLLFKCKCLSLLFDRVLTSHNKQNSSFIFNWNNRISILKLDKYFLVCFLNKYAFCYYFTLGFLYIFFYKTPFTHLTELTNSTKDWNIMRTYLKSIKNWIKVFIYLYHLALSIRLYIFNEDFTMTARQEQQSNLRFAWISDLFSVLYTYYSHFPILYI